MEGLTPCTSPCPHTSWCQTHFISSRLGPGGFLSRITSSSGLFSSWTVGAPQPQQGGSSSPVAQEASKDPEWEGQLGASLRWETQVVSLQMKPPTHFKSPFPSLRTCIQWVGDFKGQELGIPCHYPPSGLGRGRKCPHLTPLDGLGA